jgi:hypothetical protein
MAPGADIAGLSQTLWGEVPLDRMAWDRDTGWMAGDDFSNFAADSAAVASSLGYYNSEGNGYNSFELKGGSNSTAIFIPDEAPWTVPTGFNVYTPNGNGILYGAGTVIPQRGTVTITPAAASDNGQLCMGANKARATAAYPPGQFTPYPIASGAQGDVIFECRLKFSDLTNGGAGSNTGTASTSFFIGLASTLAVASGVPVNTTSFSTTPALLGFGCLSGDYPGQIGLVYNKAGGTVSSQNVANMLGLNLMVLGGATNVAAVGAAYGPTPTVSVAGPGGIPSVVAATYKGAYFKLGFKYNAALATLTPYINGIAQDGRAAPNKVIGSGTLSTNLGSAAPGTGSTTLWPAVPMTFACGLWQTGTTYQTVTIDWYRIAQLAG